MRIEDMAGPGANVTVAAGASDLRDFARTPAGQARPGPAREMAQRSGEVCHSPGQVIAIPNVSKMTLWRRIKKDCLKPVEAGGLRRYRKSGIDKILNSK